MIFTKGNALPRIQGGLELILRNQPVFRKIVGYNIIENFMKLCLGAIAVTVKLQLKETLTQTFLRMALL